MNFVKIFLFSLTLLFLSCDDGDIIISDFEFDPENTIQTCYSEESNETVFWNANDNNEIIFVSITGEYEFAEVDINEFDITDANPSSSEAEVRSTKFESIDPDNFFCNGVPDNVIITRDVIGTGGQVFITTEESIGIEDTDDDDGDGISNIEEGYDINGDSQDSDDDNIPDYRDEDDDNDRIPTSVEISDDLLADGETIEDNGFPDTDSDGLPNYLDEDDDDDDVLTRFEYTTQGPGDATNENDDGVLFYLDANTSDQITIEEATISNSFNATFVTSIRILNLTAASVIYDEVTSFGSLLETENFGQTVEFDDSGEYIGTFDVIDEDEDDDEQ